MAKEEVVETTRLSVNVTRLIDRDIEKIAFMTDQTKSEVVRTALTEFLDKERKKKKNDKRE